MNFNENGEEKNMSIDVDENEAEELMNVNERGAEKKEQPRNMKYPIVVAALVVGFAFGSLFGSAVDVFAWFDNGEPGKGEISGDMDQTNSEMGFEEARPQLEQALREEKEQEIIMEHLNDLIAASTVETNLDVMATGDQNAVVATVNGAEIKQEELLQLEEQEKQQFMMMGMDPESEEVTQMLEEMRPQMLDNLIATTVLQQKLEEENISASETEVEEYYQQYVEQFGGEEELEQQLEQAGVTKEELKQEISEQLPIQTYLEKYLEENLSEEELDFPEEELRELYEAQQQQMEQQQQMMEVE